jgi:hypothetical protein
VTVRIDRVVPGRDPQTGFRSATTDGSGNYAVTFPADRDASYSAHLDARGSCNEATSTAQPILVKVVVQAQGGGSGHHVSARIVPCESDHAGTKLDLLSKTHGKFLVVTSAVTNRHCRAHFGSLKPGVYAVRWSKQDDDHEAARSRVVNLR